MKFTRHFLAALATTLTILGCSEQVSNRSSVAQTIEDTGNLSVEYVAPEDETYKEINQILQDTAIYDQIVEQLNQELAFPNDISVKFEECGEENAYYDSENVQISMCYELIQYYADVLGEEAETQEEYEDEVIYAGLFTFFHELGHALVDQYQLPITTREEDVVDNFAAILLVEAGKDDAVIAGIDQFDIDAEEEAELEELPFWDEHSLNAQRSYNVSCIVYGSDPEKYADWVDEGWLPEDRADQCEAEYEQAVTSWETLLSPYRKEVASN